MAPDPALRPTSLKGSLLSQIPLVLSMGLGAYVARNPPLGAVLGGAIFLSWRMIGVREILCRDQRRGIRLARTGAVAEALDALEASERFWARHRLLDRYRWFFLGSAGPYTFLTLAWYNQACCLVQLNRHPAALALLNKLLATTPGMPEARELRDQLAEELNGESLEEDRTWDDPKKADKTWSFEDLFPDVHDET